MELGRPELGMGRLDGESLESELGVLQVGAGTERRGKTKGDPSQVGAVALGEAPAQKWGG